MKKIIISFLFSLSLINAICQNGPPTCSDFITIKGRDFYCGGNKFYPLVCNYRFSVAHNPGPGNDGISATSTDYYISPYNGYGIDISFECSTQVACSQRLSNDFAVIHQLGFNSIRTGALYPGFDFANHTKNNGGFNELAANITPNDFGIWATCNGCTCGWCGKSLLISTDPSVQDDNRDRYLEMIDAILNEAYNNSLKVFLDVEDGKSIDPTWYPEYKNWLTIFSGHIHSLPLYLRQTIAAYLVIEEPQTMGMNGPGYDKHTICEKTAEMYDLVKSIDPEHLISIGGGEPTSILDWDSGVMKYDFLSPHLYPDFNNLNGTGESNSDFAVERVLGKIYWLKKYCPYPFMIGETGYTATDDAAYSFNQIFPQVNGKIDANPASNFNQKNYMHEVIKMTRDCYGSGFSVWQYQENSDLWGDRDGYGILRVGNPSLNFNAVKKPVCDEFINYLNSSTGLPPDPDPNGGEMPASFYDPFHYGTTLSGAIEGYVQDADNQEKIKGAFITGSVLIDQTLGIWSNNYTYSKEETGNPGEFYLLPYDWYHNYLSPPGFFDYYISSVGASRLHYGGYDAGYSSDPNTTIINGNTYLLSRNNKNNIHDVNSLATQNKNYEGFSSLSVSNFIAESQSSADMKGLLDVTLSSESILKNGSEVLLHTGQTFPDCSEIINYARLRSPLSNPQTQTNNNNSIIELEFKVIINNMIISPNPSSGIVFITFTRSNEIPFSKIKFQNIIGTIVAEINPIKYKSSYDFSFLPKGLYFITGISDKNQQSLKLIIN